MSKTVVLNTGDSIVAKMSGAPATTNPTWTSSWVDTTADTTAGGKGSLNGVSEVTIVAAPSSDQRQVDTIRIYNEDTVSVIVTVQVANGSSRYTLGKWSLAPGVSINVFDPPASMIAGTDFATPGQTFYLGTTQVAINRTSGALQLTGITFDNTSVAGNASIGTTSTEGRLTIAAATDASLSAERITDVKNRDFSAPTDWTGTNWKIPQTATITDVTVSASAKTYTRVSGSYISDGFQVGMTATWTGFTGPANNTAKTITALSALVMTVSEAVTDEAAGASVSCNAPVLSHSVAGANTVTLDNSKLTSPPANTEIYQITATVVTKTAGTFNMGIGGASIGNTIGRVAGTQTAYVANVTCASAGIFTLTPSAAWVGWIDDISLKLVTPSSSLSTYKTQLGAVSCETITPNSTSIGIGTSALRGSVSSNCTASGYYALYNNTGANCAASGYYALYNNTGTNCTASGNAALNNNTGTNCTASGNAALSNNTGSYCTASGYAALYNNTGTDCTASGHAALFNNTGTNCTASGYYALRNNTGSNCTASGHAALYNNTGSNCTASGHAALSNNTGASNTAIGYQAGYHPTYHAQNICTFLGCNTTVSADSLTNSTAVGNGATITASNQIVLGNSSVTLVNTQTAYAVAGTKVVGAQVASIGLDAKTDSQKITDIIAALRSHGLLGPNA